MRAIEILSAVITLAPLKRTGFDNDILLIIYYRIELLGWKSE